MCRQKAPSAKRCIKTDTANAIAQPHSIVRKHRAPKGALRPSCVRARADRARVRKHRAPKGALRPVIYRIGRLNEEPVRKHRAPKGALRLASRAQQLVSNGQPVRKHRAPKGALRRKVRNIVCVQRGWVRKHRAPKGALRRTNLLSLCIYFSCQKAPSAKRCIKTSSISFRRPT